MCTCLEDFSSTVVLIAALVFRSLLTDGYVLLNSALIICFRLL